MKKTLKIVLVNYHYFITGGPERYLFNIKELLEAQGHIVIPFSIQHGQNYPSEYSSYWLSPIGDGNVTYANEFKKDIKTIFKVISRFLYSVEAARKFRKLLVHVKPDIIFILSKTGFSPSIINVAHKLKIPIVNRISDYSVICSNNVFYRNDTNSICEICLKKSKLNAIKHKCVKNSLAYSTIKVLSIYISECFNVNKKIKAFIVPSLFTLNKLFEYGIPKDKLIHIPTFFNFNSQTILDIEYNDYALYIGRIDPYKGLLTLINSFINTNYNLKIIGFSSSDYDVYLKNYLSSKKHNIEFYGKMNFSELQTYLSKCLFTIQPSECYDNMPNAVLESYAFSKAVVATRIGSLIELVDENITGLHFNYKDSKDLLHKISFMFNNKPQAIKMGIQGKEKIYKSYSMTQHYNSLIDLFEKIIN